LEWPECTDMAPDQKLIWLWLWANRYVQANGAGLIPIIPCAATLGLPPDALRGGLENIAKRGLIVFDNKTCEVFILKWFRFHKFKTPVAKKILNSLNEKVESALIKKFISEISMSCKPTAAAAPRASSSAAKAAKPKAAAAANESFDNNQSHSSNEVQPNGKLIGLPTVDNSNSLQSVEQIAIQLGFHLPLDTFNRKEDIDAINHMLNKFSRNEICKAILRVKTAPSKHRIAWQSNVWKELHLARDLATMDQNKVLQDPLVNYVGNTYRTKSGKFAKIRKGKNDTFAFFEIHPDATLSDPSRCITVPDQESIISAGLKIDSGEWELVLL